MRLHRDSLRLATLYLAIMMAISVFFSVVIYQISVEEFRSSYHYPSRVQPRPTDPESFLEDFQSRLYEEGEHEFLTAKDKVLQRLIFINFFILISGGMLSYYLALKTLKPIEEAHEAQNRFTADASHELRTPITAMMTENEVTLMSPKLTLAEARKQLQSNNEELQKLSSLSDGLLRLARLENNGLEKHPVKTNEFITSAIKRSKTLAKNKNIRIVFEPKTEVSIPGDRESLEETIFILLDNAVKYSPAKSLVSVKAFDRSKSVLIQVTDAGPGIKPDELPHIFERFYRADQSRSKQSTQGYGLGLAIAKNIVELHDGNISASSQKGIGTTFSISLPRR